MLKKILFIIIFFQLFLGLAAQDMDGFLLNEPSEEYIKSKRHPWKYNNAITHSSWYETTEILKAVQQAGYYRHHLVFPDTNALFVIPFSGGTEATPIINASFGSLFDPRSLLYDRHNIGRLSRWNTYNVDSIWIFFQYFRFNSDTTMVDTLIVSAFDKSAIQKGFSNSYAGAVNYNNQTNTAFGSRVKTFKIPLTREMESHVGTSLSMKIDLLIPGDAKGENWFGTAISYKPAYTGYSQKEPFDTVADFTNMGLQKPNFANAFRVWCYHDESKFVESTIIPPLNQFGQRILNHGIVASKAQRYKLPNPDGTILDYYSPSFYPNYYLVPVVDVHITTYNLGVHNPSKFVRTQTVARGDVLKFDNASGIDLYSLSGQKVFSKAGISSLNSAFLKEGLYILVERQEYGFVKTKLLVY